MCDLQVDFRVGTGYKRASADDFHDGLIGGLQTMVSVFTTAAKIIAGAGSFEGVGKATKELGRSALLVTGKRAMRAAGFTDRAVALLKAAGVGVTVFEDVEPEPTLECCDRGRAVCRASGCDVVIGLGGGSAIDAAKTIAGLATEAEPTEVFHGGRDVTQPGLPCLAIPTTSGTGAEVTKNSVLTDPRKVVKKSIRTESFMPKTVILDPALTLTVPPTVTAHTGLDAFTQAVEAYTSIHATPITDALALQATALLTKSLVRTVE
ncbi:MAG: iron-containing alcohol dehydrogenase, partial [Planctomycetes bacterium]|nr:iron-containing alcohol dehydrogenase [Planctomycetota bacterium]